MKKLKVLVVLTLFTRCLYAMRKKKTMNKKKKKSLSVDSVK